MAFKLLLSKQNGSENPLANTKSSKKKLKKLKDTLFL
jgi:hypothetical protein